MNVQDIPDDHDEVQEYVNISSEELVEKLWQDCDSEHIERFFICSAETIAHGGAHYSMVLPGSTESGAVETLQAGIRGKQARDGIVKLREENSLFNKAFPPDDATKLKVSRRCS